MFIASVTEALGSLYATSPGVVNPGAGFWVATFFRHPTVSGAVTRLSWEFNTLPFGSLKKKYELCPHEKVIINIHKQKSLQ